MRHTLALLRALRLMLMMALILLRARRATDIDDVAA